MSANFAHVNHVAGANDTSGSTWSASAANHGAGDLIIAVARWESGGVSDTSTVSFSDTDGNTYTIFGHLSPGGGSEDERIGVGYVLSAGGHATNVVQAIISSSRTFRRLDVSSYSYDNVVQISATDGSGLSTTNVGTVSTDTSLSAIAGDLSILVVGNFNGDAAFNDEAGFTERGSNSLSHLSDQIGAYTSAPGGTFGTNDTYVAFGFSFEETLTVIITDVDGDEQWADGDTGLVITGTGFV